MAILYKLQASQGWYQTSKLKGERPWQKWKCSLTGRRKFGIFHFWLSRGISDIIFTSFGAQLRKATHCKQVVRSTLLHLLVQGGPKGKNPGSNISYDLEILNWKLKSICIMILPRYSATIFYKLQASQGWYQMSKSKGNKFARSENVFQRGRPKVRNSRFLAFLRHLVHHFQKLRRTAAQSNSL